MILQLVCMLKHPVASGEPDKENYRLLYLVTAEASKHKDLQPVR
jgi:hypothetical protein